LTSAAGRTIIYSYGATTVRPATFLPLVAALLSAVPTRDRQVVRCCNAMDEALIESLSVVVHDLEAAVWRLLGEAAHWEAIAVTRSRD
jgi:hypothetical protein